MLVSGSFDWKRGAMIVGTLLIAFATGHVMQTRLTNGVPVATQGDAPEAAPLIRGADQAPVLPVPPAATLVPIRFDVPVAARSLPDDAVLVRRP